MLNQPGSQETPAPPATDVADGRSASTRSPRGMSEADARGPALATVGTDAALPEAHLLDYVRVLYRRRWAAWTVFVLVVSIVTVYVLTATPIYEATARLLIESEKQNVVAFKEVVEDEDKPTDAYYETLYKLIASRVLAAKTIDTL